MKHLILIVAALLVMQSLPKALAKGPMGVKIATLNLQWFGLGGEFSGTLSDEYRGPWIKEFISIELRDVDVVVFEEIVDVNAFEDLMQPNFKCVSYHHSSPYHQHVVLCHKSHLEFVKEKDDDNYAFEDSALNPMARPALHGVLKRRNGKALLRIFGVHLKAFPNETKTRLQQLAKIASRIKSLKDGLPVAILGDFNSHIAKVTKLKKDDWEYMDDILSAPYIDLAHVPSDDPTYRVPDREYALDHIWVSKNVRTIGQLGVGKACTANARYAKRFENFSFYHRFVSDHCPAWVRLNL